MSGNREMANCPECGQESMRIFYAPHIPSMSKQLKNRIEKGMEPRRMTREELNTKQQIRKKPAVNRPWQVGS